MSNWIPISERMPTREEVNGHATVWAVDEIGTHWHWDYMQSPISRFAHPPIAWHALPRYTPPKPGPTDAECAAFAFILDCITSRDQFSVEARRWFADVMARIEQERGK